MSLIRGACSMSAIEITRQDLSISQLRAEAVRTADAKQARRILAIAMVLDEHPRLLAAQAGGMDRQTWAGNGQAKAVAGELPNKCFEALTQAFGLSRRCRRVDREGTELRDRLRGRVEANRFRHIDRAMGRLRMMGRPHRGVVGIAVTLVGTPGVETGVMVMS